MIEIDQMMHFVFVLPLALPANGGLLYLFSAAGNFLGNILPLGQMLFWLAQIGLSLGA